MVIKNKTYKRLLKAESRSHDFKTQQLRDGDCRAYKASIIVLLIFVAYLLLV